ncbi:MULTISPECIES: hypothetical protein [Sphingomonas]|uniref:hypothetical protein n=1 Tax=Sphingomonas TaxID=13687 RepID=UPI001269D76F|nr:MULTISPECIES: hypothetical protein [Sphingomonas]
MSLRAALQGLFEPAERCPVIENDTIDHIRNGGNYHFARGYRCYAGHVGVDVFRTVADGHAAVTNFRHPVARIGSLYRYFRAVPIAAPELEHPRYHAVRFARERSFEEFVTTDDPRVRVYTENQHARQLTGSPWRLDPAIDMAAAVGLIDTMPCFYVCEEPARSLAWFGERFGIATIPRDNVTPGEAGQAPLPDLSEAILAMNRCDLALHDYAVARLRALQPGGAARVAA